MRNIIYILLSITVLFSSCEDDLNLTPENSVTFLNYFKTDQDFEAVLTKINLGLRKESDVIRPMMSGIKFDKVDNWILEDLNRNPVGFTDEHHNWNEYYGVITWADMIIEYADGSKLTDERKAFYLGQAKFAKAYMYFKLVQRWGDVPFVKGVEDSEPKAKMSGDTILDYAAGFCEEAVDLLKPFGQFVDASGKQWNTKQIAGKGAANALLAHIYAWKAQVFNDDTAIDKSIAAATAVINSEEFSLASDPEEVVEKVLIGDHPEVIYEMYLDFNELGNDKFAWYNLSVIYQDWPLNPTVQKEAFADKGTGLKNETVDAMYPNMDKRKYAYFYQFDELKNDPVLEGWAVMNMHRKPVVEVSNGWTRFANYEGDFVVWRLAGIILLRAEMYDKKGEAGLAEQDLNKIRERAGADLYNVSQGPLVRMIFEEREKELLAQSHRWFDCIRTGYWKTDLGEVLGALSDQDVENGALYHPVHFDAFENNPLMRQNRYWLGKW